MKIKNGIFDSMNFSNNNLEHLFTDKTKYKIVSVKTKFTFEPNLWKEAFGVSLTRNIIEAKILHTNRGLQLALKRFAINPHMQTLELAGLHSYTDKSTDLYYLLKDIWDDIQECYIRRIDIAIDYKKLPLRIEASLKKHRRNFSYKNTTYFKSYKEKKSNPRLNFLIYDKTKKENLDIQLYRLEIVFKGNYFEKVQIKNLKNQFTRMEKTIKRFTGQESKIISPLS